MVYIYAAKLRQLACTAVICLCGVDSCGRWNIWYMKLGTRVRCQVWSLGPARWIVRPPPVKIVAVNGNLQAKIIQKQEAHLSLTNRYRWQTARCRFVKLLRYCSTFLSEYVDKKFTRDYNVILYLYIFNSFWVIRNSKNLYFYHIFVCPGDAPVVITQNVA